MELKKREVYVDSQGTYHGSKALLIKRELVLMLLNSEADDNDKLAEWLIKNRAVVADMLNEVDRHESARLDVGPAAPFPRD